MTDPLESLYRRSSPAEPRPQFATQLRQKVEVELRRETMIGVQPTITPMLSVNDPKRAIQFYKDAFGATEVHVDTVPDGSIYATMAIGSATFEVTSETSGLGNLGPAALGGTSVRLSLMVPDPDAVAEQAVAAGARLIFPIEDQPYGFRQGRIEDPFGHQWLIGKPLEDA